MAVLPNETETIFANKVANALGYPYADVIIGNPVDATHVISNRDKAPTYIIIDIGQRGMDVLAEIDRLAEYCDAGTRVVVVGEYNDIRFYRELKQMGVLEYFTRPANLQEVRAALTAEVGNDTGGGSRVITFISAASGDGSSTAAMNTAFSIAHEHNKKTVLVDMDYQFGMIAKNLDLNTQFGIRELFDHPDRGIDATLIRRMISGYGDKLQVIAAPNELKVMPTITPESIRNLIQTLRAEFDVVVIDLPHVWTNWTAAAISSSTRVALVTQLWLRSITHAARLLGLWRAMGVSDDKINIIVNRSGAKFKEGITEKDFERVCGHAVNFSLPNDIRTIVNAENQGQTVIEVGQSNLSTQMRNLATMLIGANEEEEAKAAAAAGDKHFAFFKKG